MASDEARWLLQCASRRQEGRLWWWWAFGGLVALLAAFNGRGAAPDERGLAPGQVVGDPWRSFAGINATVDDIADDPETFIGTTVTVSGEVGRVMDRRSFTLGGSAFGGPELLVVGARPLPDVLGRPLGTPIIPGDVLQVTGLVRRFDLHAFRRESNALLGKAQLGGWVGKPAVLAQDVRISPRVVVPTPPAKLPAAGVGIPPGAPPQGAAVPGPGTAPAQPRAAWPAPAPPLQSAPGGGSAPRAGNARAPRPTRPGAPARSAPARGAPPSGATGAPPAGRAPVPPAVPAPGAGPNPPMGYIPGPAPAPPAANVPDAPGAAANTPAPGSRPLGGAGPG